VGAIRDAIRSGSVSKVGGLLIRSRLGALRQQLDPETVGGAYLLGLRGLVVVCHRASSRRAVANAIALAGRGVDQDVTGEMALALEAGGVLRGSDAEDAPAAAGSGSSSVSADSVRSGR
jgi:glycerol-3-phosphate acyltransferase PlsX